MEILTDIAAEHNKKTILLACQMQVDLKVEAGFHNLLGISEDKYRAVYQQLLVSAITQRFPPEGILALVEPRIPFFTQIERLGIVRDPAVFISPIASFKEPYFIWLKVLGKNDEIAKQGLSTRRIIEKLPKIFRPASPFEGINAFREVLETSFVNLPGDHIEKVPGLVENPTGMRCLCLDYYHGKPRITHTYLDEFDGLVGLLAVHR